MHLLGRNPEKVRHSAGVVRGEVPGSVVIDEVCDVVELHARDAIPGFTLDRAAIRTTLAKEEQRKEGKGLAEVVLDAAKKHDPPFGFAAGKETLAEALMDYALGHPELRGETRPILDLAEHLVRLAGANRQLRGRLRPR